MLKQLTSIASSRAGSKDLIPRIDSLLIVDLELPGLACSVFRFSSSIWIVWPQYFKRNATFLNGERMIENLIATAMNWNDGDHTEFLS
jgi:hypothetical protein